MLRTLDKPAWFANYARIRRAQNNTVKLPGYPSRLEGKIRIPNPFTPDFAQGGLYVDPIHQMYPFEQIARPYEAWVENQEQGERQAEYALASWVAEEQVSAEDAQKALSTREGDLWERALTKGKLNVESEISNPFDFISLMTGPSLPVSIAYHLAQGQPEKINLLPATRLLQSLTSFVTPGGINAEKWLRNLTGLPEQDKFFDYFIDRELSNMVALHEITPEEASKAMFERSGTAYTAALDAVGRRRATKSIGGSMWMDFFPEGEYRQRGLQKEVEPLEVKMKEMRKI